MSETQNFDEIYVVGSLENEINDGYGDGLRTDFGDISAKLRAKKIQLSELTENFKQFMYQIEELLKETPVEVENFELSEFEVSAGITATGKLALWGIGGEAGTKGGLRFVFKRKTSS
ncbi:MAG: hypothetical protein V7L13_07515 [Nostoc sp.]|uniref:Pepco domain-containing protein n=1 Tax=Nostoc sp. TaxID=1180 RepID=UPI002FF755EC